jgi:hypothetical protein
MVIVMIIMMLMLMLLLLVVREKHGLRMKHITCACCCSSHYVSLLRATATMMHHWLCYVVDWNLKVIVMMIMKWKYNTVWECIEWFEFIGEGKSEEREEHRKRGKRWWWVRETDWVVKSGHVTEGTVFQDLPSSITRLLI